MLGLRGLLVTLLDRRNFYLFDLFRALL